MGAMGKKMYSFFLTKYTIILLGSLLVRSEFGIDPAFLCALIPIKDILTLSALTARKLKLLKKIRGSQGYIYS
jgi:hypothetical protein